MNAMNLLTSRERWFYLDLSVLAVAIAAVAVFLWLTFVSPEINRDLLVEEGVDEGELAELALPDDVSAFDVFDLMHSVESVIPADEDGQITTDYARPLAVNALYLIPIAALLVIIPFNIVLGVGVRGIEPIGSLLALGAGIVIIAAVVVFAVGFGGGDYYGAGFGDMGIGFWLLVLCGAYMIGQHNLRRTDLIEAPPSIAVTSNGGDATVSNGGSREPIIEVRNITKYFGSVIALNGVSMTVYPGEVMCLLGDNGAGKSTLIKTLSGVHQADDGEYLVEGVAVKLTSPRDALSRGIATVYQDLAMIPLMSISRNFFLGSEVTRGRGITQRFDMQRANATASDEMSKMGIDVRDPEQAVGTLSGGERQSVAIARAVYFGAKVLILDEPTSALGVKQAGTVLRYIAQARARGIAVIFITHNPHHAYPIGDKFTILKRGKTLGTYTKDELSRDEMIRLMSGGDELERLEHELREFATEDTGVKRFADALHEEDESLGSG
jgi:simple sugar transport system ATP-binding protein